jgi:hypothetical protein
VTVEHSTILYRVASSLTSRLRLTTF